jgi:hypothetical protein
MKPGQKIWGTQAVPGGWYRGSDALKTMLVKAGLPATAPRRRASSGQANTRTVAAGAGAGVALAAGALLLYRRRNSTEH